MRLTTQLSFLLLGLVIIACAPSKPTATTIASYDEDLSYLRPSVETLVEIEENTETVVDRQDVEPQYHIKSELDSVLAAIRASRSEIEFLNGFTVQLYSGNNREEANETKTKVYETFEEYEPEISYIQPNFKVKIGRFFDRLEANKVYTLVKEEFPKAIVIPERIYFE